MPRASQLSAGRDSQGYQLTLVLHAALTASPSAVLRVLRLQFCSLPSARSSVTLHLSHLASVYQSFSSCIFPLLFSPCCYSQGPSPENSSTLTVLYPYCTIALLSSAFFQSFGSSFRYTLESPITCMHKAQ